MNTSTPDRQTRLALALRENLKRRKRQTRERTREAQESASGTARPSGTAPETAAGSGEPGAGAHGDDEVSGADENDLHRR